MSTRTSTLSRPTVQRRAKLFEAGEYPDKGVVVSLDNLDQLAESFSSPVPVLIEHADSPLQMGSLTAVFREGTELFGTISLTPEADALVQSSGAASLSLGLSPDLSAIREVSLVRHPRIASARLFGGIEFHGELEPAPLASEWARLNAAKADQEVADLMREGRLCPAQASFAKALLLSQDSITFNGESASVRQLALELIKRQPRVNVFSELAPAPVADHSQHLMMPEEADFYRRHFPDVSLDEIAKRR